MCMSLAWPLTISFPLLSDARNVAPDSLTMSFLVKLSVFIFMGSLMAYSPWIPSSDPQTKIKRTQNAPLAHSVQASSILSKERDGSNRRIEESYTLTGPLPDDAQHPLGPFMVVSGSRESLLVDTDQPNQTPFTSSGADELPPSRRTDQIEHAMFWGAQDVSNIESPGAATTYQLTDLTLSSRRQCMMSYKTQRRRMLGEEW